MAEEEKEGDNPVAEEALMGLSGGAGTQPQPPHLTGVQIIACAVNGAATGNATEEELEALCGKRPGMSHQCSSFIGLLALANDIQYLACYSIIQLYKE